MKNWTDYPYDIDLLEMDEITGYKPVDDDPEIWTDSGIEFTESDYEDF